MAGQAGDVIGQNETSLCQGALRSQGMKALTVRRTGRGEAQSVIQDVDGRSGPAERAGGRAQGVLQTQAFLVAPHLMGGGWPDVHEGLAGQRLGGKELGVVQRSPPGRAP